MTDETSDLSESLFYNYIAARTWASPQMAEPHFRKNMKRKLPSSNKYLTPFH